jgi:hypothetical protein
MRRAEALPYVSFVLDDALNVRTEAEVPHANARFVGWQCGFEPLFVAVVSYLGNDIRLDDDEAVAIATDYLAERDWFGADGPREPDYVL